MELKKSAVLAKAEATDAKIKNFLQRIADNDGYSTRSRSSRSSYASRVQAAQNCGKKEAKLEAHRVMFKHLDEELALEAKTN